MEAHSMTEDTQEDFAYSPGCRLFGLSPVNEVGLLFFAGFFLVVILTGSHSYRLGYFDRELLALASVALLFSAISTRHFLNFLFTRIPFSRRWYEEHRKRSLEKLSERPEEKV